MTTRRLVLIRHAKAAQAAPDFGRPLTGRGRRDAAAVGEWLVAHSRVPDLAVVSPAVRATQTWELAAAVTGREVPVVVEPRVYTNTLDDLIAVVGEQPEEAATLAVVGHNPSVHALALRLAGSARDLDDFATATVAVIALDVGWDELAPGALETVIACRG